jgi:hypothetical protein
MLERKDEEEAVRLCTEKADLDAFKSYTARNFVFEIIRDSASGEWRRVDAMKRRLAAFKENFTAEFGFTATCRERRSSASI